MPKVFAIEYPTVEVEIGYRQKSVLKITYNGKFCLHQIQILKVGPIFRVNQSALKKN